MASTWPCSGCRLPIKSESDWILCSCGQLYCPNCKSIQVSQFSTFRNSEYVLELRHCQVCSASKVEDKLLIEFVLEQLGISRESLEKIYRSGKGLKIYLDNS